jgi:hypothetical protein
MVSAISEIALSSVVIEGKDRVKKISGKLAANYKPGQVVIQTAAGPVWTQVTGSVSENRIGIKSGVVEFKKRTHKTNFGEMDIDQAYTYGTEMNVEIIVGPRDGTVKLAVFGKQLGAAKFYGNKLCSWSGGTVSGMGSGGTGLYSGDTSFMMSEESNASADTVFKVYMI